MAQVELEIMKMYITVPIEVDKTIKLDSFKKQVFEKFWDLAALLAQKHGNSDFVRVSADGVEIIDDDQLQSRIRDGVCFQVTFRGHDLHPLR